MYNDVFSRYKQQNVAIRNRRHKEYSDLDKRFSDNIRNSGTKVSSWINDLFGWVKSSIGGFRSALPIETSNTTTKLQVDAPMDINGTIILLDVLIRKVTGQKYISTVDHSVSPLEAQGYALNIIEDLRK